MNYEIRKIDRPIEDATTGIVASGRATTETDKPMIAETEDEFFDRRQHLEDSAEGVKVQHYKAMRERAAEYEAARIAGAEAVAKARTVSNLTRHSEKLEASLMIVAINNATGGVI